MAMRSQNILLVCTLPKTRDLVTVLLRFMQGFGRNLVNAEPKISVLVTGKTNLFSNVLRSPVFKFLDYLFIPRQSHF